LSSPTSSSLSPTFLAGVLLISGRELYFTSVGALTTALAGFKVIFFMAGFGGAVTYGAAC